MCWSPNASQQIQFYKTEIQAHVKKPGEYEMNPFRTGGSIMVTYFIDALCHNEILSFKKKKPVSQTKSETIWDVPFSVFFYIVFYVYGEFIAKHVALRS